jgi:hypothetical protein
MRGASLTLEPTSKWRDRNASPPPTGTRVKFTARAQCPFTCRGLPLRIASVIAVKHMTQQPSADGRKCRVPLLQHVRAFVRAQIARAKQAPLLRQVTTTDWARCGSAAHTPDKQGGSRSPKCVFARGWRDQMDRHRWYSKLAFHGALVLGDAPESSTNGYDCWQTIQRVLPLETRHSAFAKRCPFVRRQIEVTQGVNPYASCHPCASSNFGLEIANKSCAAFLGCYDDLEPIPRRSEVICVHPPHMIRRWQISIDLCQRTAEESS